MGKRMTNAGRYLFEKIPTSMSALWIRMARMIANYTEVNAEWIQEHIFLSLNPQYFGWGGWGHVRCGSQYRGALCRWGISTYYRQCKISMSLMSLQTNFNYLSRFRETELWNTKTYICALIEQMERSFIYAITKDTYSKHTEVRRDCIQYHWPFWMVSSGWQKWYKLNEILRNFKKICLFFSHCCACCCSISCTKTYARTMMIKFASHIYTGSTLKMLTTYDTWWL